MSKEYIEREALIAEIEKNINQYWNADGGGYYLAEDALKWSVTCAPAVDVVEADKVAELLCLSFGGDACACNFNGNDEWLWEKCKYAETECPTPKDELACWKEYVKAMLAKMNGKGEGE